MKTYLLILFMILQVTLYSQQSPFLTASKQPLVGVTAPSDDHSIDQFSLSINPLGFVQFGPIINAEIGLKENLVLNVHTRFPSLGVLSYVVAADDDGLDALSGSAFGGGLLYFLGEKQSKPYFGALLDYQKTNAVYAMGEQWEWKEDDKSTIFIFNGGYRFRFDNGFFINVGAFLGAAATNWDWEYKDLNYGASDNSPRTGKGITAFGMLETTFGIKIK